MSLNVTVIPKVALPDLASVEAAARGKLTQFDHLLQEVEGLISHKLGSLNMTEEQVRALPMKALDSQLRGFLKTRERYQREIETANKMVDAWNRVNARIQAGEMSSLFNVLDDRDWGRTRLRIYVRIADPDLLLLHRAGIV